MADRRAAAAERSLAQIEIPADVLADPWRSSKLEWLETNGASAYAASTVIGANTRREHGLLVAPVARYGRLHSFLSRVEETLRVDGYALELGCNFYPGAVHPQGHRLQTAFRLAPFPTFAWWAADRGIEKSVFLVRGESTVVVRYTLFAGSPCLLSVRPFVTFREVDALTQRNGALDPHVDSGDGRLSIRPYASLPALHLHHEAKDVAPLADWWLAHEYPRDAERGPACHEDLWSPCTLRFELATGSSVFFVASLDRLERPDPRALERAERERPRPVVSATDSPAEALAALVAAAS